MRSPISTLFPKILSSLFAATLAFGLVPAAAFAVEDDTIIAASDTESLDDSLEPDETVEDFMTDDDPTPILAGEVINQVEPLQVVAQQESTRSYLLAQTLESTRTVPVVSAQLPMDTSQGGVSSEGEEGETVGGVSAESTVVGSFEYLGMTFAIESDGASVALVAADYSKLPEGFIEKQVVAIPESVTPDGIDTYSVTRMADDAFAGFTTENANSDYVGCEALFTDEELLAEAGIDPVDLDEDDPLAGCTGILAIGIPASVTTIEDEAFAGFDTLQYIVVSDDSPDYASYDGALYSADLTNLRLIPEGRVGAVCVAPSAITVDPEVFSHCPLVNTLIADADCEILSQLMEAEASNNEASSYVTKVIPTDQHTSQQQNSLNSILIALLQQPSLLDDQSLIGISSDDLLSRSTMAADATYKKITSTYQTNIMFVGNTTNVKKYQRQESALVIQDPVANGWTETAFGTSARHGATSSLYIDKTYGLVHKHTASYGTNMWYKTDTRTYPMWISDGKKWYNYDTAPTSAAEGDWLNASGETLVFVRFGAPDYTVNWHSAGSGSGTVLSNKARRLDMRMSAFSADATTAQGKLPAKDGFVFRGWNTDPNAKTGLTSDTSLLRLASTSDVIDLYPIYVKRIASTYQTNIVFVGNTDSVKLYADAQAALVIQDPVANGWKEGGFAVSSRRGATSCFYFDRDYGLIYKHTASYGTNMWYKTDTKTYPMWISDGKKWYDYDTAPASVAEGDWLNGDGETLIFVRFGAPDYTINWHSAGAGSSTVLSNKARRLDMRLSAFSADATTAQGKLPAKDTFTFLGWNTDPNAKTALASDASLLRLASASDVIDLYPIYTKRIASTFQTNIVFVGNTDNAKAFKDERSALVIQDPVANGWEEGTFAPSARYGSTSCLYLDKDYGLVYKHTLAYGTIMWYKTDTKTYPMWISDGKKWYDYDTAPASVAEGDWLNGDGETLIFVRFGAPDYTINWHSAGAGSSTVLSNKARRLDMRLSAFSADATTAQGKLPAKDTFTFLGWNTDPNAKTALASDASLLRLASASDVIDLYPIYTKRIASTFQTNIVFVGNTDNVKKYVDEREALVIQDPVANSWKETAFSKEARHGSTSCLYFDKDYGLIHKHTLSYGTNMWYKTDTKAYPMWIGDGKKWYDYDTAPASVAEGDWLNASGETCVYVRFGAPDYTVNWHSAGSGSSIVLTNTDRRLDMRMSAFSADAITAQGKLPAKEGYFFRGWNTDPNAKTALASDASLVRLASTNDVIDLYPIYGGTTYAVTYVLNGDDDNYIAYFDEEQESNPNSYIHEEDADKSSIALASPKRAGYKFSGWKVIGEDGRTIYDSVYMIDCTLSEDLVYTALWTPVVSVTLPITMPIDFRIDAATGKTEDAVTETSKMLFISSSTPVETSLSLTCTPSDDGAVKTLFEERESGALASLIDSLGFSYDLSESHYITAENKKLDFTRKDSGIVGPLAISGSEGYANKNSKKLEQLVIEGPLSLVQANADKTAFADLLIDLQKVHVKSEAELREAGITDKVPLADIVWTVTLADEDA